MTESTGLLLDGGYGANDLANPTNAMMAIYIEDHIMGVFWAVFLMFSWIVASIVSGSTIERMTTLAYVILTSVVGTLLFAISAAWGWHFDSWMLKIIGYHDDATAAIAVHGFSGCIGLVLCGIVLNGYPSSGYSVGDMWDGATYASINPLGQLCGAFIMFVILGVLPGYIIAKILNSIGMLRIPREVEIAGLDFELLSAAKKDEQNVTSITK